MSAEEVDEYLRGVEEPKRTTLEGLRRTILEIVPDAEELISYRVPAFRVGGATIAGFAAFRRHLSYLPFSGSVLSQLADELAGYEMTKSALHFPVDRPLPKALVERLIAVRLEELQDRADSVGVPMPNSDESAEGGSGSGPRLLSGGNPQIPKGEGDEPVQAYIAAMPGWKRSLGERLDELIVRTVPDVHKAVKWNQPFYGHQGEGWFLAFRCYTSYVQLQFFRGASLDPVPPKASKHEEIRYLDIHEDDELDEGNLASWIEQASNLPGEKM